MDKKQSIELKNIVSELKDYILQNKDRLNKDMVDLVQSWEDE